MCRPPPVLVPCGRGFDPARFRPIVRGDFVRRRDTDLVAETRVDVQDLVAPLFVREAWPTRYQSLRFQV